MGPAFSVDTFWYLEEFAKSRGMIHWHGLCWCSDREPHNLLYEATSRGLPLQDSAAELSKRAKSIFGMTASHPAASKEDGNPRKDFWLPPKGSAPAQPEDRNPLTKLLMDVCQTQESLLEDHLLLSNRINLHNCSNYCLRPPRTGIKTIKDCRMEIGNEQSPGKRLKESPAIAKDKNGSLRLEIAKGHPQLVQHSRFYTQGWTENDDISLFLSKSSPENPSVDGIMATEKYTTSYVLFVCLILNDASTFVGH